MSKAIKAQDILSDARKLVEIGWMAAGDLQPEQSGPMRVLLGVVKDHIEQSSVLIFEYRVEKGDGPRSSESAFEDEP